jgi:hypothetical protein
VSAAQRDQVGVLSDYGFAPAEIARRLDLSPPQIEHILRSRIEGPKPFSNP